MVLGRRQGYLGDQSWSRRGPKEEDPHQAYHGLPPGGAVCRNLPGLIFGLIALLMCYNVLLLIYFEFKYSR